MAVTLPLWGRRCRFYLGIPEGRWLSGGDVRGPVFLSDERLRRRVSRYPRGAARLMPWARDSGAFSMLFKYGAWRVTPAEYAGRESRWADELGAPDWSAAQDWMCEPHMVAKTGLTVREHQRRTVARFVELRAAAHGRPYVPVVQGWALDDYRRHLDDYTEAGIDLLAEPLVGVGSTCRRQGTRAAGEIYAMLHEHGLVTHIFGASLAGIRRFHPLMASADSMAWSSSARRESVDPGWAANRVEIAELYRDRVEAAIDGDEQQATERWRFAMRWTRRTRPSLQMVPKEPP